MLFIDFQQCTKAGGISAGGAAGGAGGSVGSAGGAAGGVGGRSTMSFQLTLSFDRITLSTRGMSFVVATQTTVTYTETGRHIVKQCLQHTRYFLTHAAACKNFTLHSIDDSWLTIELSGK